MTDVSRKIFNNFIDLGLLLGSELIIFFPLSQLFFGECPQGWLCFGKRFNLSQRFGPVKQKQGLVVVHGLFDFVEVLSELFGRDGLDCHIKVILRLSFCFVKWRRIWLFQQQYAGEDEELSDEGYAGEGEELNVEGYAGEDWGEELSDEDLAAVVGEEELSGEGYLGEDQDEELSDEEYTGEDESEELTDEELLSEVE